MHRHRGVNVRRGDKDALADDGLWRALARRKRGVLVGTEPHGMIPDGGIAVVHAE